jgi:hypothetical protein
MIGKKSFLLAAMGLVLASGVATGASAQPFIQFDFGPPPVHGSFWEGAPPSLGERIHLVDIRMQHLHSDGWISGGEWNSDRDEWNRINILFQELPKLEGGQITPREHAWLWSRLNNLSNRLHWQSSYGY